MTDRKRSTTLVLGATSIVGRMLLPRLNTSHREVVAVSRHPPSNGDGATHWLRHDVGDNRESGLPPADELISLMPIWLLPPLLQRFAAQGGRRVIAFSSTSALSKSSSADSAERTLALKLSTGEETSLAAARQLGIAMTILRPTMIYDGVSDKNVMRIADTMRRLHFFPLFGGGRGQRQPVHADDLALATIAILENKESLRDDYNLSGGEILSYRDMVYRIRDSLGLRATIMNVPLAACAPAIAMARCLPRYRELNIEMLRRMNRDLVFDHATAQRDFGYRPRPFRP